MRPHSKMLEAPIRLIAFLIKSMAEILRLAPQNDTLCHSGPAGEESTAPAVVLRVIPKDLNHRDRDPCAAAKALATRGREYPQDDREGLSSG